MSIEFMAPELPSGAGAATTILRLACVGHHHGYMMLLSSVGCGTGETSAFQSRLTTKMLSETYELIEVLHLSFVSGLYLRELLISNSTTWSDRKGGLLSSRAEKTL